MQTISVIIPALNEERFIGKTLEKLNLAVEEMGGDGGSKVQIIVVDYDSTDQTAAVARGLGATVVKEPTRNIARARNAGAQAAEGEVLYLLDADTLVPPPVLSKIAQATDDTDCVGGAIDILHQPTGVFLRMYLWCWRILAKLFGLVQGASQFCRREMFSEMGGYDETIYMGEDSEFYFRLARAARKSGQKLTFVSNIQVVPSTRRYDSWPLWKILLWTNPVVVALLFRSKGAWRGWYEKLPR